LPFGTAPARGREFYKRTPHENPDVHTEENFEPGFFRQSEEVLKAIRNEANLAPDLASAIQKMRIISTL
jgi:hypothetical protein